MAGQGLNRQTVAFVFGFFKLPHFLPLLALPEVSRSSTGSLRNLSPVSEHWHLPFAVTVSFPVHRSRSAVVLAVQFSFLNVLLVPSRPALALARVLVRILRPLRESETSAGGQRTRLSDTAKFGPLLWAEQGFGTGHHTHLEPT
jgi:hypothetical protein